MKPGNNKVVLGLGSNLGDRAHHLSHALELLSRYVHFSHRSTYHEFPALLPEGAPAHWNIPYLNMVAAGTTELPPPALLAYCKAIETELGRPAEHAYWSPRSIDIDILDYNGMVLQEPALTLPHPGMAERDFVLQPLAEIMPDWSHPVSGLTSRQLLQKNHTKLVGILNITPDSFADGGLYTSPDAAFAQAKKLLQDGAAILDIGAESTRPGATPLNAAEEWQRLEPVLNILRQHLPHALLSIDTRQPETVRKAMAHRPAWINDVSGFNDPALIEAVKNTDAKLVVMHNLGVPADKNITLPQDCDPVAEVSAWLEKKVRALEKQCIARDRIILDPGLGFGKTAEQSLLLVKHIAVLKKIGCPILLGHSEKSFLSLITDKSAGQRSIATQRVSTYLAQQGVDFLRVHDAAGNMRAIASLETITL